jgi:antibiotic biosynthesis monooxygenase (ABM) superfamily enzyme
MYERRQPSRRDRAWEPSTIVVSRVVHPGQERRFERWAHEIDVAAGRFPGHLGNVRLHDASGINYLVYSFDSPQHLHAWETSEQRRSLVAQGDEISDENRGTVIGMDAWFAIAGQSATPKWKTFLITWLAVYPVLLLISYALKALAPNLARPAQLAISSLLLTSSLTWLIMPFLARQLRTWLLRGVQRVGRLRVRPARA